MVMWLVSGIPHLGLWEEYYSMWDGVHVLFFFKLFVVWSLVAVFSGLFLQECCLEALWA